MFVIAVKMKLVRLSWCTWQCWHRVLNKHHLHQWSHTNCFHLRLINQNEVNLSCVCHSHYSTDALQKAYFQSQRITSMHSTRVSIEHKWISDCALMGWMKSLPIPTNHFYALDIESRSNVSDCALMRWMKSHALTMRCGQRQQGQEIHSTDIYQTENGLSVS